MKQLIARFGKTVKGVLTGFDRIVFKGTILPLAFPTMSQTLGPHLSYDWTLWQSEWATDLESSGQRSEVRNQLTSDLWPLTSGTDGLRVRHWVDHNSAKVYNEQNVLRIETTINMPDMFRAYRRAQGQPQTVRKKLRPLRKGVADIPLRAQLSQEVNNRLMGQLSSFNHKTPLIDLLTPHVRGRTKEGRRVRALDFSAKDRQLLQGISDADFTVCGISNAALRKKLASTPWGSGRTDKQLSARISRHLRLLRDHGIIRKVPNRHRYHLTDKGRQLTTALNAMLSASTEQLLDMAA